ncbi:MAG: hypothetical protein R3F62_30060 [Planctomycetota bacterium]
MTADDAGEIPAGARRWAWVVAALLVVLGAGWRAKGLDPDSLWLDDLWVAVLAQSEAWGDLVRLGSSTPVGFSPGPLGLPWSGTLNLGAQLPAYLLGVLAIVQVLRVGHRAGGWPGALAAGGIVACHPLAIAYAARVKQYSGDLLLSALHLEALLRLSAPGRGPAGWRLPVWAALGAVGFWVSTMSVFVVWVSAPFVLFRAWQRGERAQAGASGAIVVVGTAAFYLGYVSRSVNASLSGFWVDHFFPLDLAAPAIPLRVLHDWLGYAGHGERGPLGQGGVVLLWLALIAGAAWAWRRPALRSLLGAAALLILGLCALNVAGRLPLRTGRVEIFVIPWVALFCGLGVRALWERCAPDPRLRVLACGLLLALGLQLVPYAVEPYPAWPSRALVTTLGEEVRPGDAVWVNLHGTYALAYYGGRPAALVEDARLGSQYHPEPRIDGLVILDDEQGDLDPVPSLDASPPRVWVLGVHQSAGYASRCDAVLVEGGYVLVSQRVAASCALLCYEHGR